MRRSIFIVDDQTQVLETAVAIVEVMLPEANVSGFINPFDALEAIKANRPDLILADQRMPGMSGSQLLEEVRFASPTSVRIIMSGFIPLDKLKEITSAHQYVAKPFEAPLLKQVLERTLAAQDRVKDKQLQNVVTSLRSLPSLPHVHQTLLAELNNEQGASSSIGQMVAQDAGLSAKVLQLANSPLFGRGRLVTNPEDAVFCLGTSIIAAVVISQSLFKNYQATAHPEFSFSRLWSHCWETAALAHCYCREQGLPRQAREEAFLAGLLHETGRLILIDNFPAEFQAACDAARQAGSPLGPQMREVFQADPCQIAAYLLDLWGLPNRVASAVSLVDHPEEEQAGEFTAAAALYIANQVSSRETSPDAFPPAEWNTAYLRSIGCDEDLQHWARGDGGLA
jgi:HD-like signal output (HDOD) protein/CheY-like chemotaxis protein